MKKKKHMKQILFASLLLSLLFVTGCVATVRTRPLYSAEVVIEEPPPPRVVVHTRPPMPQQNAVWAEGSWRWNSNRYVWVKGHWIAPRAGYVYVQPRWVRQGRGWRREGGTWKARGNVRVTTPRRNSQSSPRVERQPAQRLQRQPTQREQPQSSPSGTRQPKTGVRVK